jgi:nicotinamidase-related amidase
MPKKMVQTGLDMLENTQELSNLELESVALSAKKTMLVIVDVQNDFVKPGGIIYLGSPAENVINPIKQLLNKARSAGIRVLFTKSWYQPNDPRFLTHTKASAKLKGCMAGTWGAEIVNELQPQQDELIILKPSYDCWFRTDLEERLADIQFGTFPSNSMHVNRLMNDCSVIVTGVATNICVYHTVTGFYLRGYDVIIPIDCVAATSQNAQMWALYQFKEFYHAKLTLSRLIEFVT